MIQNDSNPVPSLFFYCLNCFGGPTLIKILHYYSIMYLYGSGIAMLQALHNWDGLLLSSKDSFENGPSMFSLAGSE